MSVEQVKAFFDKIRSDESLAQKLKDADAFKGDKSDKEAAVAAIVIPIAAEAGFNFTVDDFKAAFDSEKLSEDELKAVAGGGQGCRDISLAIDFCEAITYFGS